MEVAKTIRGCARKINMVRNLFIQAEAQSWVLFLLPVLQGTGDTRSAYHWIRTGDNIRLPNNIHTFPAQ